MSVEVLVGQYSLRLFFFVFCFVFLRFVVVVGCFVFVCCCCFVLFVRKDFVKMFCKLWDPRRNNRKTDKSRVTCFSVFVWGSVCV